MNILRPVVCRNLLRNYSQFKIVLPSNHLLVNINRNFNVNQRVLLPYSTTTMLTPTNDGIIKNMFKKLKNSKSKLRGAGILLYENIADGLNYFEFFKEFEMKDSFNSWFLVTELHVWLILTRVMQEGANPNEDGRFLRNCIVEAMWADIQMRSKKLGSDNPAFTRQQVSILSEQFQASLLAYDEGLSFDDKTLASALWRRFFNSECDDFGKLEKLVKYVRKTSRELDLLTRDQITSINTKISWLPLND
ncbi:hypothetical protein PVAND_008692 [Polypedilum vanderplanki]|uniref:Ubiquinol-cytochrome c chaperone domain-containing protein n=1 Tax=Polypedilum vanderplanki TaxID=319348 RepID=A0A9J6CBI1_POLVA|nr:hypothetical protein PVAND_008692 [Polypedilum vanderplanki]